MKSTDIRLESVHHSYEDYIYRTPIKFGGVALDRVTLLNVACQVRTRAGKVGRGIGSMPLSNVWAFPSRILPYEVTLQALRKLSDRLAQLYGGCADYGHPIDLTWTLEQEFAPTAATVSQELHLAEPIPILAALVCASPFDAALHDAYGKVHGLNVYHTYGPDFMNHDLGHYLGADFQGETLDRYLRKQPQPRMPLYHLVGASIRWKPAT